MNDRLLFNDWHPIAREDCLEREGVMSANLLGEEIVLWRSKDGVHAWQDLCLHRGTRLSLGTAKNDMLECPYHGWTYNAEGRCVHIPAHPNQEPPTKARTKSYHAQIRYGLVWVCLGEPSQAVTPFDEGDDARYRKTVCGPYRVEASAPRIVENFLDVGHFPFVHEGILGDRKFPEIADYEAKITPNGVVASGIKIYQPDPYGIGVGDWVTYTYKTFRPLVAYFVKEASQRLSILLAVQPHSPTQSTAWMVMAMNYAHNTPEHELVSYQDRIFAQDQPIVQSQRPELLPLDLQTELHLKSDRTAIAYRKWLNQLGLSFGTS
jgi:phenylpropionate dioxygenase-like ring-hydroxylating dioxygenase large terminal subunit